MRLGHFGVAVSSERNSVNIDFKRFYFREIKICDDKLAFRPNVGIRVIEKYLVT